jgi:hypothetical protein
MGGTVNWTLIVQLSFFGLPMGIATVFVIPLELFFWLVVFAITAYVIATRCSHKRFTHGLLVGIAQDVWVAGSHVLLLSQFLANHPKAAARATSMGSARLMVVLVGLVSGVVSGVVIGLCALLAGKLIRPPSPPSVFSS